MKSMQDAYYSGNSLGIQKLLEDITDYNPPDDDTSFEPHNAAMNIDSKVLKNLITIRAGETEVEIMLGQKKIGVFLEENGIWYIFNNYNEVNTGKAIGKANSKEEAFGNYINYLLEQ